MSQAAESSGAEPQVQVEVVKPQDIPILLECPGRTAGFRGVEVRAQVSGILQQRTYEEGARVEKGQVLFRIDPRQYQAADAQAESAVASVRPAATRSVPG